VTTGTTTAPVGPTVRLQTFTCQTCTLEFNRPLTPGRPPKLCTECRSLRRAPRGHVGRVNRIDTNAAGYRWAHAVAMQRLAIELARTGLRTALLGLYDGPKLEAAVKQALADLDAVVDGSVSRPIGAWDAA
jgi:hypothetical protein